MERPAGPVGDMAPPAVVEHAVAPGSPQAAVVDGDPPGQSSLFSLALFAKPPKGVLAKARTSGCTLQLSRACWIRQWLSALIYVT